MKSTQFVPIQDHVLVKPIELNRGELANETGIVIELEENNSIIDRPTVGTVVAIGEDTKEIKVGMYVMWLETDGQDVTLKDGNFLMLKERSILGYRKD